MPKNMSRNKILKVVWRHFSSKCQSFTTCTYNGRVGHLESVVSIIIERIDMCKPTGPVQRWFLRQGWEKKVTQCSIRIKLRDTQFTHQIIGQDFSFRSDSSMRNNTSAWNSPNLMYSSVQKNELHTKFRNVFCYKLLINNDHWNRNL